MNSEDSIFDFHESTPDARSSSRRIFEVYLECKQSIKSIPRAYRGQNQDIATSRLLKEELRRSADGKSLFRKSPNASDSMARFWLSRVREAAHFYAAWKDLPDFTGLDKDFLSEFARLSQDPDSLKSLEEILSTKGVILVHEPAIPGMKVDGACFLLETGRPVIALSLRQSRLDIYWFVLMHELAHVTLHYEQLQTPIFDNLDEESAGDVEIAADQLAANSLIPRTAWRSAGVKYDSSPEELEKFAIQVKTHPSVVAGRLRRELGRHDIFSKIINRENSRKIIFGHE